MPADAVELVVGHLEFMFAGRIAFSQPRLADIVADVDEVKQMFASCRFEHPPHPQPVLDRVRRKVENDGKPGPQEIDDMRLQRRAQLLGKFDVVGEGLHLLAV